VHPSAERVQTLLAEANCPGHVKELADSTRTSLEAATALGVEVGQIAKSLVFAAGDGMVLVVASGADRVDISALSAALNGARIRRADADSVRAATGYAIGGVSPVGLPEGLPVLVDRMLSTYDVVWAAAGTPHAVFPTTYDELLRLTGGAPADVRERPTD